MSKSTSVHLLVGTSRYRIWGYLLHPPTRARVPFNVSIVGPRPRSRPDFPVPEILVHLEVPEHGLSHLVHHYLSSTHTALLVARRIPPCTLRYPGVCMPPRRPRRPVCSPFRDSWFSSLRPERGPSPSRPWSTPHSFWYYRIAVQRSASATVVARKPRPSRPYFFTAPWLSSR